MSAPLPDTRPDRATALWRVLALAFSALAALAATAVMTQVAAEDSLSGWDIARSCLIFVTTGWLAWGAAQALIGLAPRKRTRPLAPLALPHAPTVLILPICNEDPVEAFARVAAMDRSMRGSDLDVDIAVLSDTRDPGAIARERAAFAMLLGTTRGDGRIFYRNREVNRGRKAGNIEDFIRRSGGAYEFAVVLDADSLMEGQTIRQMIARMQAEPDIGLLQTLPKVTGARSLFGRAMQFAASFHSPVFARGLARMQGRTGPFWGHNAIVRVRAVAECCGLPELQGKPPFGGTILSHDYVEAALLARGGWRVTVDEAIGGSYEEGPDNILSHAKRDRRWCQGNLQHIRLLAAPGLKPWSRFVFLQGITAYLVSLLWAGFLVASVLATVTAPPPDYFPEPHMLFPVFPDDRTREIIALAIGIGGLLVVPKLAILIEALSTRRAQAGFGGGLKASASMLAEILMSSLIAPLMLMYQTKAVLEVLSGRDGGWPANQRGEGSLTLSEGWRAGRWISVWGIAVLAAAGWLVPALTLWLLPVALPMLLAPVLIAVTSWPIGRGLFLTPEETHPAPILRAYRAQLAAWRPVASDEAPAKDAVPAE